MAQVRETPSKNSRTHISALIHLPLVSNVKCKFGEFLIGALIQSNPFAWLFHTFAWFFIVTKLRLANIHLVVFTIRSHHYSAAGNRHHNHRHFDWTFQCNGIRGRAFNQFWPEKYLEQDAIAICNGNELKEHFAIASHWLFHVLRTINGAQNLCKTNMCTSFSLRARFCHSLSLFFSFSSFKRSKPNHKAIFFRFLLAFCNIVLCIQWV